jgi:DNA-binding IclR family transcriptional regulator
MGSEVNHPSPAPAAVKTLSRGLELLKLFVRSPVWTQSEIAEATGLSMATVYRLCSTLVDAGFLEREAQGRRLRCGVIVLELAGQALAALTPLDLVTAQLQALADVTGETANLAILAGGEVVYLQSAAGKRLLGHTTAAGLRVPAYCTAIGKCLLAQLDPAETHDVVGPEPYPVRTKHTITSWKALSAALEQVRAEGIAESDQEYELGLYSLAVPVPSVDGGRPSAISVSPPTSRATAANRRGLARELHRAAEAIAVGMRLLSV